MTLNQLYYFKTVAQYENYHQAAEQLFISQPSLSRSMASLEEELGVRLFEKSGRGIVLTKAGHLFLEYANRITEECEIAIHKMQEMGKDGGRIDIGYVFPLANTYMPHHIRCFLNEKENKNVTFGIVQGNTAQIVEKVKTGQADVGFCGFTPEEPELEFYPVLSQEIVVIVPKNHPLALQETVSIMDVVEYPMVGYERKSWFGEYTSNLYRRLEVRPNILFECPDENSIQALVREDFGVAVVAKVDTLDEDAVKILHIDDAALSNQIFMVWRKDHYQLPSTARFVEYMKKQSNFAK
ncbi:MAG: LysR family transcriptional regulator [Lachnospiraceae bacterium]|nr:LysR family transcriptional regulator [Lachnospiraceae bacterium]